MNLKNELTNIYRFKRNFFNNNKIEIPEPILATNGILIEQFKLGHSLGDYMNRMTSNNTLSEQNKYTNHFVVTSGFDTLVQMMFRDKFLHVDLHPGNLMLQMGSLQKFQLTLDAGTNYSKEYLSNSQHYIYKTFNHI